MRGLEPPTFALRKAIRTYIPSIAVQQKTMQTESNSLINMELIFNEMLHGVVWLYMLLFLNKWKISGKFIHEAKNLTTVAYRVK